MSAKFRRVKRRKVEVQEGVEDPEGCSTSQLDIEQSLGDFFYFSWIYNFSVFSRFNELSYYPVNF